MFHPTIHSQNKRHKKTNKLTNLKGDTITKHAKKNKKRKGRERPHTAASHEVFASKV